MAKEPKSKTTSTEIVVTGSVPEYIIKLNQKLADLKIIQESAYKTSKRFDNYNLETETDVAVLIKMYSSVKARSEAYADAQQDLSVPIAPAFKIEGSTVDEWKADIQLRIAIIQQKDTFDKLTSMKKRWEELMDKEDKKKMLEKEMEDLL